MLVHNLHGV
jgi:hypothetical protein